MNRWNSSANHVTRWTTEGSAPRGREQSPPAEPALRDPSAGEQDRGSWHAWQGRARDARDPDASDVARDRRDDRDGGWRLRQGGQGGEVSFENDYERDGDLVRADYYREDYLYDDPRGRFDEHGRDLHPEELHDDAVARERLAAGEDRTGHVGMGLRERVASLFGAAELPRDRGGEATLSSASVVGWARERPKGKGTGLWARAREAVRESVGHEATRTAGPPLEPTTRERDWAPPPRHVPHRSEPRLWSRVRGVFQGVGPKNYVRPDARIMEDVCERLAYHPYVNARDVEVHVRDGEVTLMGTIDDREAKRLAEDVAYDVAGVKDVHNEIRVR